MKTSTSLSLMAVRLFPSEQPKATSGRLQILSGAFPQLCSPSAFPITASKPQQPPHLAGVRVQRDVVEGGDVPPGRVLCKAKRGAQRGGPSAPGSARRERPGRGVGELGEDERRDIRSRALVPTTLTEKQAVLQAVRRSTLLHAVPRHCTTLPAARSAHCAGAAARTPRRPIPTPPRLAPPL